MSWLNNSLNTINTIKGQLTNLAQEVLAETAGPGDDEYRGGDDALSAQTALQLLNETQLRQLDKACEDKDREIVALRKQITTLKASRASEDNVGGEAKSLVSRAKIRLKHFG
ncbi:GH24163 [Drosophila grimshawi]|uniref:GH24163 n=1 Tax=Drosophila grimshawi TaxID=7222 RepID=B4JNC7_DROGR|nr:GH24163 [Drosophila grimshawi]